MISVLHPSRGRPDLAFETYRNWKQKAKIPFEYILSIDSDDPAINRYKGLFAEEKGIKIRATRNRSLVDATNGAALLASGWILIYLSDDFDCPQDWDELIKAKMQPRVEANEPPKLLKVHDGLQPFKNTVLTIPIMNWTLYNKLGYFWNPNYLSQWVDVDLYYRCEEYIIFAPDLVFEHKHYSSGKAPMDSTYKRNEGNWSQGLKVLNRELKKMGKDIQFDKAGHRVFDTRR